jgi:hypothetical protein
LLTTQAAARGPLTLADVQRLDSTALARRLIGNSDLFTHKRLCGTTPGTGCETGGWVRAIKLSTDFTPTRFPNLCTSEQMLGQLTADAKAPTDVVAVRLWRPSRVFRLGDPCRGTPRNNETRGDFELVVAGRSATAADAWLALRAARLGRAAIEQSAVSVRCENAMFFNTSLCSDPAAALSEDRLAEMRRATITSTGSHGGKDVRLELRGGSAALPTHVRVSLDLATRAGAVDSPITLRAVAFNEYPFVD